MLGRWFKPELFNSGRTLPLLGSFRALPHQINVDMPFCSDYAGPIPSKLQASLIYK